MSAQLLELQFFAARVEDQLELVQGCGETYKVGEFANATQVTQVEHQVDAGLLQGTLVAVEQETFGLGGFVEDNQLQNLLFVVGELPVFMDLETFEVAELKTLRGFVLALRDGVHQHESQDLIEPLNSVPDLPGVLGKRPDVLQDINPEVEYVDALLHSFSFFRDLVAQSFDVLEQQSFAAKLRVELFFHLFSLNQGH